jgi:hypothetical protein
MSKFRGLFEKSSPVTDGSSQKDTNLESHAGEGAGSKPVVRRNKYAMRPTVATLRA